MTDKQVKEVFDTVFWSGSSANMVIGPIDHQHAEIFLKELVEGTCKMSIVEGLFRSTFSFNPSLSSILKAIAKSYASKCNGAIHEVKFYTVIRYSEIEMEISIPN